ncbi:RNA-guided endonuclease InsQ/TnpB family protein [Paenibacillus medicaginis]|uniref:RNA-guided endonuclease InsQ/TnpB family protein n=1 Tax=Paenibacillus medicaginis TaxID=1470560 RepID=A0ABV5C179_9BACL
MQITYQFRLYPTPEQEEGMIRTLILCRKLYNRAKEQRDTVYNQEGTTVTYAMQQNELPAFKKEFPEYKEVHSQVLQDCLRRLDDAYQRFFRGDAGFPHYKSADRYLSFTYPQPGAVDKTFARNGYVYLSKIGFVRLRAHHGCFRRLAGFRCLYVHTDPHDPSVCMPFYVDLGHIRPVERNQKVVRQRKDFLHKQSHRIVQGHDLIAVEQLKVKNMICNRRLSKSIADAGWRRFITYLSYKAARQGKRLVEVPAHGTSQTCICGADVPKTLAIRLHECEACGLVQDRDIVSAQVILQRALDIVA